MLFLPHSVVSQCNGFLNILIREALLKANRIHFGEILLILALFSIGADLLVLCELHAEQT
jgi:hypothetical protein